MYRRYDFKKIFEAEQAGEPLNPTDMGIQPAALDQITQTGHAGYEIDLALTEDDINNLKSTSKIIKTDASWKKSENLTDVEPIENLVVELTDSEEKVEDAGATVTVHIKKETADRVMTTILEGGMAKEAIGQTKITFTKAIASSLPEPTAPTAPADLGQEPMAQPNESANKQILSFNQFLNEGSRDWVADVFNDVVSSGKPKKPKTIGKKVTKKSVVTKKAKK